MKKIMFVLALAVLLAGCASIKGYDPKAKRPVPPPELKWSMVGDRWFGFTINNDMSTVYYAKVGEILKTKDNKTVPYYDTLKLVQVKNRNLVLEMNEVTGEMRIE